MPGIAKQKSKSTAGAGGSIMEFPDKRRANPNVESTEEHPIVPIGGLDLFLRALDDLSIGIAITEGFRFSYVNDALCTMFGYTRDALINLPSYFQLIPVEDHERLLQNLSDRLENKSVPDFGEATVIRSDGRRIHVEYAPRVFEKDGRRQMYSFVREITGRKQSETKIRLLATAVESTSEIISITDSQNHLFFVNHAFLDAYGYTEEEVRGRSPRMLIPGPDGDSIEEDIWRKTREGKWKGELLNQRKDGSVFPIHLSTSPIFDADGSVLGYIGVARDIAEQKAAEQTLFEAEKRFRRLLSTEGEPYAGSNNVSHSLMATPPKVLSTLAGQIHETLDTVEESIRQVLSFSSFASHELRNPLTVMRSSLESALSFDTPVEELRLRLTQVYDEVLHLIHMVEMLLDVGRMQAGTLRLEFQSVNLATFVREFSEEATLMCAQKGIQFVLGSTPEVCIGADPHYIRQVFCNLFDNACKHTDAGGRLELGYVICNNEVILRFADTGSGILPQDLPKIFEPFFKGSDPKSRNVSGSGLGLTLVKWIVEAHAGSITAESSVGVGTTVEIRLPSYQS